MSLAALKPLCAPLAALLAQALSPVAPVDPKQAQPKPGAHAPVQLHIRQPEQKPFYSRAAEAVTSAARRLFFKEEPHAAAGNLKVAQGEYQQAMGDYDASEKVAQSDDAQAALAFNRSAALLKGPAEAAPKALEQALRAQESPDKSLRSKAAYHAALALEGAGKTEEAMKAYAHALSLDPDDVDSKVNLELLLRSEEERKRQSKGGQDQDQKKKDPQDQKDQQQQSQKQQGEKDEKKEQRPGDKEQQAQKPPEQKEQKPEQQQQPEQKGEQQQQAAGEEKKEPPKDGADNGKLGRSEAQRLLDAAKQGEKNLQTWRFGKKPEPHKRRAAEKDW